MVMQFFFFSSRRRHTSSLRDWSSDVCSSDLLVGQHRYVAQGFYWEMPTGGMHPGESPDEAAQRELAEEAGCEAGSLVKICDFHTSKSILRETAHLYLARD